MDPDIREQASSNEDARLSAYERAALGGDDPRCVPQSLPEEPPIGDEIEYPGYPDSDQKIWRTLFDRQMNLLPGRAAQSYLNGVEILGMSSNQIPALRDLSSALHRATGWKVARIPGLLHERDFFGLLAGRIFPSTDYIRGVEELDYTPAPDLFHDMFGHMPMLADLDFADFYQRFGKAALNATGEARTSLERLHWFTVEFGLVDQTIGRRVYGAGILSSKDEVKHALSDDVIVHPFDPSRITEQDYEVWHLQPELFVVESFAQLDRGFKEWTARNGLA